MTDAEIAAELNRLYWDSEESVGDIGDRLDLSRRALYDALEPLPTGATCPECGGDLVYRNRTARDRGEAECPECDRRVELEDGGADEALPADETPPTAEQEEEASSLSPMETPVGHRNGPLLAIALVGGIAFGAVVGYLHRSG